MQVSWVREWPKGAGGSAANGYHQGAACRYFSPAISLTCFNLAELSRTIEHNKDKVGKLNDSAATLAKGVKISEAEANTERRELALLRAVQRRCRAVSALTGFRYSVIKAALAEQKEVWARQEEEERELVEKFDLISNEDKRSRAKLKELQEEQAKVLAETNAIRVMASDLREEYES